MCHSTHDPCEEGYKTLLVEITKDPSFLRTPTVERVEKNS